VSRRLAPAAVGAALAFASLFAGCGAPVRGSERIEVHAPRWVLPGRPARLEVETRRALRTRDVVFTLMVNLKVSGSYPTRNGTATIEVPARLLGPGPNHLILITGTERAELSVRVLPPAALAAAIVALVFAAWLLWRRARRNSEGAASAAGEGGP